MEQSTNKRNTIIYGGAFNPPTRAHQAILQACVDHAKLIDGDVWLLPSGNRTDKAIDVSNERRIGALNALSSDIVRREVAIRIVTNELERQEQTETYDTVRELEATYPQRRFSWVFGSDSVATMPEWHGGEWMMDNLPMLIVERPGSPVVKLGALATILPVEASEISSTRVRQSLDRHESIHDLVSPTVEAYLSSVMA